MTMEQQRKALVLTRLLAGDSAIMEAAALLGLSERPTWRLRARFAAEGPAAVVHGTADGHHRDGYRTASGTGSPTSPGPGMWASTTATSRSCSPSVSASTSRG